MSVHGFAPMSARAPPAPNMINSAEVPLVFTLQPKRVQKKRRSFLRSVPLRPRLQGLAWHLRGQQIESRPS